MNAELSEDTRNSTIIVWGTCFDLHTKEGFVYICKHGTYDIQACMTPEFYSELTGQPHTWILKTKE